MAWGKLAAMQAKAGSLRLLRAQLKARAFWGGV
jgi:hypothetical protein